jgi:uncharacterized protein YdeI (BOF family)
LLASIIAFLCPHREKKTRGDSVADSQTKIPHDALARLDLILAQKLCHDTAGTPQDALAKLDFTGAKVQIHSVDIQKSIQDTVIVMVVGTFMMPAKVRTLL